MNSIDILVLLLVLIFLVFVLILLVLVLHHRRLLFPVGHYSPMRTRTSLMD